MKTFPGFPDRTRYTPLPEALFTSLLPQMDDIMELKAVLYFFRALSHKRGYLRFVSLGELSAEASLLDGLGDGGVAALGRALDRAVERGCLLKRVVQRGEEEHQLYFLNDDASRQAIAKMEAGLLPLGEIARVEPPQVERRDIFSLYEQNIGLLTPIIAEQLKEAEGLYPASWIEDAFREAVAQNKRRWSYISRILERWAAEGREDGKPGRYSKEDPDKYIKGRYGHIVRR